MNQFGDCVTKQSNELAIVFYIAVVFCIAVVSCIAILVVFLSYYRGDK